MKSIVYSETGDPSVLRLEDREVPAPGPGEVRVRVVVSGVNPTDWKNRSADAMPFPEVTPHLDGAGFIDAVGAGVDGVAVGDRVWMFMAAATGKTVLVAGGAGAVGHAAIQLARWAGATVISTVSSPAKAVLATAGGAHHVVNYRDGDPAAEIRALAPDGVHVIVEVALAANLDLDRAVLANRGTISVYANNGGDIAPIDIRPHMVLNTRFQFLLLYTVGEAALEVAAADITAALRDGALPIGEEHGLPLIRFPLAATADAHRAVEADAVGKVLVDVSEG
jgi:NADPH2:quinone reductase